LNTIHETEILNGLVYRHKGGNKGKSKGCPRTSHKGSEVE